MTDNGAMVRLTGCHGTRHEVAKQEYAVWINVSAVTMIRDEPPFDNEKSYSRIMFKNGEQWGEQILVGTADEVMHQIIEKAAI